ncbi:MAG: hypothetical protein JWQ09_5245 [Segetibacter sp.]|nr:hypothetical protein [Segetibacter sp.]
MKSLIFGIFLISASIQVNAQNTSNIYKLNEEYTSGLFRSTDAYLIDVADDYAVNAYRNVFQYLTGKVPGLTIIDNGYNIPFVRYRSGYPAFFVDEIRVDASAITSINMNDIALIKVFRPPFVAAVGGGGNGAIAVYTKDGSEDDEGEDAGK